MGSFSLLYGRFEANVSLPTRQARGVWPAFWLMPASGVCWPTGGEVDIFEYVGSPLLPDFIYGSYHWAEPNACGKDQAPLPGMAFKEAGDNWQTGFHVYTAEWSPNEIDYKVDGKQYYKRTSDEVMLPTGPMYIILNQAVQQDLPPGKNCEPYVDGVDMVVDWVRVCATYPSR
eukprot:TRINITY_DN3646_c0_g1_i2.p1 TRINITY_DN3646_c0_g1~~TRINITY_DN3646_c0_g1_i2.p1  ORF type:complete len:173 (-),score=31.96 TRINITY_DN3646_c0_g1_i2:38-556(-)